MSKRIKGICLTAVFAALTCALSPISIPTPFGVPITLQTFIITVTAFLLGIKAGTAAILCYVLLGVAGLPVFSGFTGGAAVIFGATGGFIICFPLFALIISLVFYVNKVISRVLIGLSAVLILYTGGIAQFLIISKSGFEVAIIGFIPYFIKDVIIVLLSYFLCGRIRPTLQKFIQPKR